MVTTTNTYQGTTGQLQSSVRNGETTTYTYDDFDRVTQVIETIGAKSFTFLVCVFSVRSLKRSTETNPFKATYYTVLGLF